MTISAEFISCEVALDNVPPVVVRYEAKPCKEVDEVELFVLRV
jgi:hypothetical protein